ncbi:MAG TPA: MBL fold metallo-hydrolase [Chthonomonadaceae bacterium]|nr:MBL fold metallo-hydrolase [Chthonomonadaceae bacterium]
MTDDRQAGIAESSRTQITFLGTAAVVPGRGQDSTCFVINGKHLVDTGWYGALKMLHYGLDPMDLDTLILTHCHHDHYLGLPLLLFYRSTCAARRPDGPPLKIIGPQEDLERVVRLALQFLQSDRYPVVAPAVELFPLSPGDRFETDSVQLEPCVAIHTVPALCYRFTDRHNGKTFAFTGDTAPSAKIVEHVRGLPLLIHEASYGPAPAPADDAYLHSGAPDAARIASEARVGRLALVHGVAEKQEAAVAAAQALFPNTFWPADGQTVTVE